MGKNVFADSIYPQYNQRPSLSTYLDHSLHIVSHAPLLLAYQDFDEYQFSTVLCHRISASQGEKRHSKFRIVVNYLTLLASLITNNDGIISLCGWDWRLIVSTEARNKLLFVKYIVPQSDVRIHRGIEPGKRPPA